MSRTGLFAAFGLGTAVGAVVAQRPRSAAPGSVPVTFGRPTRLARLRYEILYEPKPYPDAVLLYYDNGLYAILSPGENHYGTYVLNGDFDEPTYSAHFISLPSADWNGKSVYHLLQFDTAAGTFTQQLTNPDDRDVPRQTGTFTLHDNVVADPTRLTWEGAQSLGK
ncbi:hypothetical protein DFR68_12435 [Nocardia mexicana]|uniref:Uncharacterized protein n=2 Tax=Nocardia mexicana TaxID=279262 RepID=A0A370GG56_9NOCA|nr:hypothetical protein DFR68_12435 [Nocardia mexicana]